MSLVHAGETGGKGEVMLERLSRLTRQRQKMRLRHGRHGVPAAAHQRLNRRPFPDDRLRAPRFAEPLPAWTPRCRRAPDAHGGSDFARGNWIVLIVGVAGSIVGGVIFVHSGPDATRSTAPSSTRAPRHLVRGFLIAQTTRLLGVLVQSQVPLLDALELTKKSTASRSYRTLIERGERRHQGDSISTVLCNSDLVPISVSEAVRNGEQSGKVGQVLIGVSDFLDEDNEVVMRSLTSIIEPIILIVLGLLVGFVAISMFLPLFDLDRPQGGPAA